MTAPSGRLAAGRDSWVCPERKVDDRDGVETEIDGRRRCLRVQHGGHLGSPQPYGAMRGLRLHGLVNQVFVLRGPVTGQVGAHFASRTRGVFLARAIRASSAGQAS